MTSLTTGILILLLTAAIVAGIAFQLVKVYRSRSLNKWVKLLIGILALALSVIVLFLGSITGIATAIFGGDLSKNPREARTYLKSIEIGLELPTFKVTEHQFANVGGDDQREHWDIKFTKPLTEEFIAALDSLCRVDSRWTKAFEMAPYSNNDTTCHYFFSYWDPEHIEIREMVIIYPKTRTARLEHLKI